MDRTVQHTLFTEPAHEAGATGAQSRDVVTVASIFTLADLRAVLPKETKWATCSG